MAEDKENMQKILYEYEQNKAQIEALQEGVGLLSSSIIQMETTIEALKSTNDLENDNEILLPLGSDSFLRGKITDTKTAIVGIGADVAVKKTISEAIKDIESRKDELMKVRDARVKSLEHLIKSTEEMAPQIQELMAATQKEG